MKSKKIRTFVAVIASLMIALNAGITAFANSKSDSSTSANTSSVTNSTSTVASNSTNTSSISNSGTTNNTSSVATGGSTNTSSVADSSGTETSSVPEELSEITLNDLIKYYADGTLKLDDDSSIDYYGDDYYDTDGNATLINNQQIIYNSDEMQFISVTTKDGNVFYILINYSDSDNIDNVYFLNKVDSFDLYSLLYTSDDSSTVDTEAADKAAQQATGGDTSNSVDSATDENAETTLDSSAEASASSSKSTMSGIMKNLIILGTCAVIAAVVFFVALNMKKKNKSGAQSESDDYSFDDDEDDINEDEE